MKNEKLYPKEKQKGVVFYRNKLASQDMSEDPEDIDAIDIDVDDEVKEVVICYDLIMTDSKKSFPNVESLVIKSNVFEIRIPNSLFPNVKWVQSERDRFKTGNCLVLDEGNIFCTLLNTFCKKEGEVIKIDDITAIKNGAFSGCESTNLTGAIDVYCGDDIEPDAFAGSAFAKQPFVNGVKMAGNIVIDIDKTSEEIIIPDYDYEKAIFIANTDLTMVKKLVVHRYETARQVNYDTNFPEMLVLDTNDSLSGVEIRELAHISSSAVSYLKYFSISSCDYKTIDGIVYTKNGKIVVAGSLGLEHVVIPEGVEKLGHSVFRNCKMKSVVLPDSIDRIRAKAFCQCENLKSVKLGNNVDTIEDSAFAECCSLKHMGLCECALNSGVPGMEENLFQYGKSGKPSYDTAFAMYSYLYAFGRKPSDELTTYIRRVGKKIAEYMIESNRTHDAIRLISFNILTSNALKSLHESAVQQNRTEVAAYLMEAIKKNGKSTSMRL